MLIQFRYSIPDDVLRSMYSTFGGSINKYMTGYMEQSDVGILNISSLFIVCNHTEDSDGKIVLKDPVLLVVAQNHRAALNIYTEAVMESGITDINPTIFGVLMDKCKDLKVQPV